VGMDVYSVAMVERLRASYQFLEDSITRSMPQISQLVILRCVSAERRAHNQ